MLVFPHCPSYGFTKRADYSVTIVERASGIRSRNRNWYYPLHVFVAVLFDNVLEADASKLQRFWHAIGGQSGDFLFKDWTDFTSALTPSTPITPIDQPVLEVAASSPEYQLVKLYEDDEFQFQQQRLIQKPKQGTIRVAEDGVELEEGVDYSIDYDTGIITPLTSLDGVITWGGEFYVPVMFETVPEFMVVSRSQSGGTIQQTGFSLRELRLPYPEFASS